jgi:hypothetical protein
MILIVIDDPDLGEANHANSVVIPCFNCASCVIFALAKSTQLDPTLQLNHML